LFPAPTVSGKPHLEILRLLKGKRNGHFIEAGVNDREFLSTTFELERDYGWKGILVEPDPVAFSALKRTGRKSWLSDICFSVSPKKVRFVHNKRTSTLSNVHMVSEPDGKWKIGEHKEFLATCFPFYSLVSALNMTVIDYFSLGIKKLELAVLKTIPFDSVLIRTLSVQFAHNRSSPNIDKQLNELMNSKGYRFVKKLTGRRGQLNIYAHPSV
jgi:hypothetical protein